MILFDDLVADAATSYAQVCRFLGVDDTVRPPSTESVNTTYRPRSRTLQYALTTSRLGRLPGGRQTWMWNARGGRPPPLDADVARGLRATFAADNARLADRLQHPLPSSWSP